MSKRFTETEIWNEDWFVDMPVEYKVFYFYLKDQCNHAGIWRPNLRIFEAVNEVKIDLKKALNLINTEKERIIVLPSGHWFLADFFVFQYGHTFNRSNRVHESIENIYNKEDIKLTSIRGLKEVKDRVKDKDIDKDTIKDIEDKNYIYSEFYDKQIAEAKNDTYEKFVKFLYGENELGRRLVKLTKMKDQVSFNQFEKLIAKAVEKGKRITELCLSIENNKQSYTSLYLTLNTWLNKGY
jgi:predicted nucleic-acid-binding Zn-ribbon protein